MRHIGQEYIFRMCRPAGIEFRFFLFSHVGNGTRVTNRPAFTIALYNLSPIQNINPMPFSMSYPMRTLVKGGNTVQVVFNGSPSAVVIFRMQTT